jgi:YD repeat-containing protein
VYDPIHWGLGNLTFGNNAFSNFSYDPDQVRLKSMKHVIPSSLIREWNYTYDPANRLMSDAEDAYTYDNLSRLTGATIQDLNGGQSLSQAFSYDAFGNRLSSSTTTVTGGAPRAGVSAISMAFNAGAAELLKNQLPLYTTVGVPTGATYDAQGNLTKIFLVPSGVNPMAVSMAYDALGRVTSLGDTKNATSQTYTYDDQGLRIKVVDIATGKVTYNIYNEARQLIAVYELVME